MEETLKIYKNFDSVPCGQRSVQTVQIENTTKEAQELIVRQKCREAETIPMRLEVQPQTIIVQPKQIVTFKLIYFSGVDGVMDNFRYDILNSERIIAELFVHGYSVGPTVTPTVFNLKFFRFRNVNQTVRRVELANTGEHDATFFFDLDEDYKKLEITPMAGVIPAKSRLVLKLTFNSTVTEVFFKKIFCIVQFHEPIIFNILAIINSKLNLVPKNFSYKHTFEETYGNAYEAFMDRGRSIGVTDKLNGNGFPCMENDRESLESNDTSKGMEEAPLCWSDTSIPSYHSEAKLTTETIFFTKRYIDIQNSPETSNATSLVNLSKEKLFYYEWDSDPKQHFQIMPCRGLINSNTKVDFTIYFSPSLPDTLYHVELDMKVCIFKDKSEDDFQNIDLPLTLNLRINGHSFPDDSCGWVSQCKLTPNVLHLRSCVPDEKVYGTFMLNRKGHLPVNFSVVPPKDSSFTVYPAVGHLSKDFQLFVVQFNSMSKGFGFYTEELKIKFNKSNLNIEKIKIIAIVEIPLIVFGRDNSIKFPAVFPDSKSSDTVVVENLTNLFLNYELKIPEDITWIEIVNPTGSIDPNSVNQVEIIFKPDFPCEYLDYIPCVYSSISKPEFTQTEHLQVVGSCQYGYLIATPSIYDFGKCIYKKNTTYKFHLFNFSATLLYFRLTVTDMSFPAGDPENDVKITPDRGVVPGKGSLEIEITVQPNQIETLTYDIECQNFKDDSEDAEPCEAPKKIIFLKFEGVLSTFKIVDLNVVKGGPLFSPHWLWKMLRVNEINKALQSTQPETTIIASIPHAIQYSPPTVIGLVLESNEYDSMTWEAKIEIKTACLEASAHKFSAVECLHTEETLLAPTKYELGPSEQMLFPITINYRLTNECLLFITFKLPGKRKVILRMPLISLSEQSFTTISLYLNPTFDLKPVFIGDPQPPVQLFWLYNNNSSSATYLVDTMALAGATALNVFECLNPEGVIQPFSSYPLQIVFRPYEIMQYLADLHLIFKKKTMCIKLAGEGVLNISYAREIGIQRTIPDKTNLKIEDTMLECCENFVNIKFLRVFSRTKRAFFIQNTSKTEKWCFNWSNFDFENLFSVKIIPPTGLVNPGEKKLLFLFLQSYGHPTFISFSVPCEVINFSAQMASKGCELLQQLLAEQDKDYFTITEKGTTYRNTEVAVRPKPSSSFIYITLNATIVSNESIDQKLTGNQQVTLRTEKEVPRNMNSNVSLNPSELQCIQGLMENILWDILCSTAVTQTVKNLKSQDFTYEQLLPQKMKRKEVLGKLFMTLPQKHLIQKVLESVVQDAFEKFISSQK